MMDSFSCFVSIVTEGPKVCGPRALVKKNPRLEFRTLRWGSSGLRSNYRWSSSVCQRQRDNELAALSRRALNHNVSAVRICDMPNQRQTKAAPLCIVHQRISGPVKFLENLRLIAAGNANAMVLYLELYRAIITIQLHTEEFFFRRIFRGVVDQIYDRAGNCFPINSHHRQVRIDALLKSEPLWLDLVSI